MKLKRIVRLVAFCGVVSVVSCVVGPVVPSYTRQDMGSPIVLSESVGSSAELTEERSNRPGLGTGWGETIDSSIGYTKFKREGTKPYSLDVLYYNDKDGVKAMSESMMYDGKGMQKGAKGLVEWGVKSGWGYAKNINTPERRFVVGKSDAKYSIVVRNVCHSRIEVVVSVDGLDVLGGEPASIKKRGYMIEPGKKLVVKGFRTSEEAVAAFKFSSVKSSYSNLRHGSTRNVGVIGMAVYTEEGVDPWRWSGREVTSRKSAQTFAEAPLFRAQ